MSEYVYAYEHLPDSCIGHQVRRFDSESARSDWIASAQDAAARYPIRPLSPAALVLRLQPQQDALRVDADIYQCTHTPHCVDVILANANSPA